MKATITESAFLSEDDQPRTIEVMRNEDENEIYVSFGYSEQFLDGDEHVLSFSPDEIRALARILLSSIGE